MQVWSCLSNKTNQLKLTMTAEIMTGVLHRPAWSVSASSKLINAIVLMNFYVAFKFWKILKFDSYVYSHLTRVRIWTAVLKPASHNSLVCKITKLAGPPNSSWRPWKLGWNVPRNTMLVAVPLKFAGVQTTSKEIHHILGRN